MGRRRDELLERAATVPSMRAQADAQVVALKAQGSRVYDVDNIGYIDYLGGQGSAIVGFANQFVLDSVKKTLLTGVPGGVPVPLEVDLAESLQHVLPWVGCWWFCRNHDEAMRELLAWVVRSTGKRIVVTLDGGARLPVFATGAGGLVDGVQLREVPGWDVEAVEASLAAGASKAAALVVDPLLSHAGVVPAPDGALERISEVCRRMGVLLVLDERVSGFRVHRGGAASLCGVVPDVAVYGGALGGGFPIGVVAFADHVDHVEPEPQDAPPPSHPVSLAAAEAVLSILKNDTVYERLEERTGQLADGVLALAARFSRPMTVNRLGSAFALYQTSSAVRGFSDAQCADARASRRFAAALLAEGVLLPGDHSSPAFVSSAHGAKDIDETLAACERVLLRLHQEDLP